jgi:oligosaccharyltransferase complex subunit delta (ribophorin II)
MNGSNYVRGGANIPRNRLSENKPLSSALSLGGADTMKIILTTKEGSSAKMPHQAFLLLKDIDTGLDYSYPFSVKDSGKSKVELVRSRKPSN